MNDFKALGDQLFKDGYDISKEYYNPDDSILSLRVAQRSVYEHIDTILEGFAGYAARSGKAPGCREGCSWCCYQKIYALSSEMEVIKGLYFDKESADIQQKIIAKAQRKKQSEGKEPCPFLHLGSCRIYAVRPVACRIYLSSSVESCITEFRGDAKAIPALFEVPLFLGRMMNEGFVKGLQSKGLKVEEQIIEEFMDTWSA